MGYWNSQGTRIPEIARRDDGLHLVQEIEAIDPIHKINTEYGAKIFEQLPCPAVLRVVCEPGIIHIFDFVLVATKFREQLGVTACLVHSQGQCF